MALKRVTCNAFPYASINVKPKWGGGGGGEGAYVGHLTSFLGLYIRAGRRQSSPASLSGFAGYFHCLKSQDVEEMMFMRSKHK